jgi:phospholipid/cholesterol/gamma-HCH transport system permease protein
MLGNAGQETGAEASAEPRVDIHESADGVVARLSGPWITRTIAGVDKDMRALETSRAGQPVALDLSGVERMDTAGAWIVERLIAENKRRNVETRSPAPARRLGRCSAR